MPKGKNKGSKNNWIWTALEVLATVIIIVVNKHK